MGAKVGNLGGGMVELFSWNASSHSLSPAEIQKLKEYAEQYSLIAFDSSVTFKDGANRNCYKGASGSVTAKTIYDLIALFQNGYAPDEIWIAGDSSRGIEIYVSNSKTFELRSKFSNTDGNPVYTLKIYGIK